MTIRFHLDEHIHPGIAIGLRARGVDTTTTQDAGLLSASDDDQLAFCITNGRVMVTNDRDFLRLAASGLEHPGIAYCHREDAGFADKDAGFADRHLVDAHWAFCAETSRKAAKPNRFANSRSRISFGSFPRHGACLQQTHNSNFRRGLRNSSTAPATVVAMT